jgi:hypothetical protein
VGSAIRLFASCLVATVALLAEDAAAAAPKRITGKLSKPGYTVIALAANGDAAAVRASGGSFRLQPPAKRVTVHLRGPDGRYAGPVVVGRAGKRAIVGVMAGARLGAVRVRARKGYARLTRPLRRRSVDRRRIARARKGVPIGAGVFGRVRSRPPRRPIPGDTDFDGVPDALDVDDDGDLILDDLDRASRARASQATPMFHVFSDLSLPLERAVNANPRNSLGERIFDDGAIDTALPSFGTLAIGVLAGDSAELDCASDDPATPAVEQGRTYCTRDGTGTVIESHCCPPVIKRFPDEYDTDGDGFGTLIPGPPPPAGLPPGVRGGMFLQHGATSAEIGTGDMLIEWVSDGVPEAECPPLNPPSCTSYVATQRYIFATVPALVSFSDGQAPPVTVSYPVTAGGAGTPANPYGVRADPSTGDVTVTLTFWRPQRRPIAGEAGPWVDVGGLAYAIEIPPSGFVCPQSALSTTDPTLGPPGSAPSVFNGGRGGFIDRARDQVADPANTLTYSLNLTQCLAANGISFNVGESRSFTFQGINPFFGGRASQGVTFKRE